jgi:hypothetical protein
LKQLSFSIVILQEQTQTAMNFMILLILCLIIAGFSLLALGIRLYLRKKQTVKDFTYKNESIKGGKNVRCGCGRGNCCAIE